MAGKTRLKGYANYQRVAKRMAKEADSYGYGVIRAAINAEKKARDFLLESLNENQRKDYLNNGYFLLTAYSGRAYALTSSFAYSVHLMALDPEDGGLFTAIRMCVNFEGFEYNLPIADHMYMLKTLLQARGGEELVIRRSNWNQVEWDDYGRRRATAEALKWFGSIRNTERTID